MGGVPVFLVGQRPLELDAKGVVLLAFGHIISYNEEDDAQKDADEGGKVKFQAQRGGVNKTAREQRDKGHDPKNHSDGLGTLVNLLFILARDEQTKPVKSQKNERQDDHGQGGCTPAIHLPVRSPMNGELLGELIPQYESYCGGNQYHKGGNENFPFIIFNHDNLHSAAVGGT